MKLTDKMKDIVEIIARTHPYSPQPMGFVSHPLISSNIVVNRKDITKYEFITGENWNDFLELAIQDMRECDTVQRLLFVVVNKPYWLEVLDWLYPELTPACYAECLKECWIGIEFPHQYGVARLVEMFKRVGNRMSLMNKEEQAIYQALPGTFTVFRGVQSGMAKKTIRGLSWTLSHDKAIWFARRFHHSNKVYQATIEKKHVFAYFGGRDEQEIVVNPRMLKGVEAL